MAYDEVLAGRIRDLLAGEPGVTEMKMFGGLAFLVDGHMAVAASGHGGALVRCDPKLDMPDGCEPMIMRGRPMDGWLRVGDDQLGTDQQLAGWVSRATTYVRSLPPKS